jgi:RNA polymerase sigma-70 factor (ECF subfamily)
MPADVSQGSDWGQLMAAAQDGQGGPYRRLLGELRHWLTGFYGRRLPPAQVEDAVQDTLIAIHDKRHTYDRARPFKPWLVAIARYKWIDRLRAMTRTHTAALDDDVAIGDHEAAVTSAAVLDQLLGELKPAQQAVIRLVKLQGYSIEEASARTGQSQSLVKVNIHRGLARMTALIERQGTAD